MFRFVEFYSSSLKTFAKTSTRLRPDPMGVQQRRIFFVVCFALCLAFSPGAQSEDFELWPPSGSVPVLASESQKTTKTFELKSRNSIPHSRLLQQKSSSDVECNELSELFYEQSQNRWSVGNDTLQRTNLADLLDCVEHHDVILLRTLDSDDPIEIRERIVINKSITITADPPQRRGDARVRFTCPETEMSVFDIWASDVRLENISIEKCNLTRNASPLVVHGHVKNLTLFQLSFKDNHNQRKAATIRFSRRMSGSLSMTSVTFQRNSGAHSIARLPKHTYMRDVILEDNNCHSPIFAFPKDSDISVNDLRAELNKNTVLMLRNSNLTLTDSYFGYNGENMAEMEGGALTLIEGSFAWISSSRFHGNRAEKGGALFATDSTISISDSSELVNNSAHEGGGCFFEDSDVRITESSLLLNIADNDGGAIRSSSTKLMVYRSNFDGNQANNTGGCILFEDESLTLSETNLTRNSAKLAGALKAERSDLMISDCVVSKNNASNTAGSCYFDDSTGIVVRSLFKENEAAYGGSAYVHDCHTLVFRDTKFLSNRALQLGGAVDVDIGTLAFQNVSVQDNVASLGGGFYFFKASITATEMIFRHNEASEGGAFTSNKAAIQICVRHECEWPHIEDPVNIADSPESFGIKAINNIASNGGGALDLDETDLNITHGIFRRNRGTDGGAIHVWRTNCHVRIQNTLFDGNAASSAGGSVYARAIEVQSIKVEFDSVNFTNNAALIGGGDCSLLSVSANFKNCHFFDCSAEIYGGALFITQHLDSNFSESVVVEDSIFTRNTADSGAAIYALDAMALSIRSSEFRQNRARLGKGGGIFGTNVNLELSDTVFVENRAEHEGGGFFLNTSRAQISGSSFEKNRGQVGGGGAFLGVLNTTLEHVLFQSNEADDWGGGIRLDNSSVEGRSMAIVGNNAAHGGGISTNYSELFCIGCRFDKNRATWNGGGIAIESGPKPFIGARFIDTSFRRNIAELGGAVYFLKSYQSQPICTREQGGRCGIAFIQSEFIENLASVSGSAIHTNAKDCICVFCSEEAFLNAKVKNKSRLVSPKLADKSGRCASWVAAEGSPTLVSSYAVEIRLELFDETPVTSKSGKHYAGLKWSAVRQKDKADSADYHLENLVPGKELPAIKLVPVDQYGNKHGPVHGAFNPVMTDMGGQLLEGRIAASKIADRWRFLSVRTSFTNGRVETLSVHFEGAHNLQAIRVKVTPRRCTIGEIRKESGVLCEECDNSTYSFNPDEGRCLPCPDNAGCNGRFVFPKKGYWQSSPCDTRITECLSPRACSGGDEDSDEAEECDLGNGANERTAAGRRSCALLRHTESLPAECPVKNATDVIEFQNLQCSKGHQGPLCGICSKGFALSGNYGCIKCPSPGWHAAIVLLAVLVVIGVVAIMIRGNFVSSTELVSAVISRRIAHNRFDSIDSSNGPVSPYPGSSVSEVEILETGDNSRMSRATSGIRHLTREDMRIKKQIQLDKWRMCEIVKVAINFMQAIAVATIINVKWARFILGLLRAADVASGASFEALTIAVYCICENCGKHRGVISFFAVVLSPLGIVLIFIVYYAYKMRVKKRSLGCYLRRILLSFSAVMYVSYLNVTKQCVEVFSSVRVPSYSIAANRNRAYEWYWVPDTSLEFLSADHQLLFSVALVITVCFSLGFPVLSAITLHRYKKLGKLGSNGMVYDVLGFMYRGYTLELCFWESVVMLRKACLSIIAVFSYSLGGSTQGLLATFVLVIGLFLQTMFHPFRKEFEIINRYESYSLIISCQTFILSSFFVEGNASREVRIFLSLYLGGSIIGFMIYLLHGLVQNGLEFLRLKLQAIHPGCCQDKSTVQVVYMWGLYCLESWVFDLDRQHRSTVAEN